MKLVVATRSAHKLQEIRAILRDVPDLEVVGLTEAGVVPSPAEEDLEPFATFAENARSKAEYFHLKTGLPTVADDSGLEVDALKGAPGVRSKRFAPGNSELGQDAANNAFLLKQLAGVPDSQRNARYVCVAALIPGSGQATRCFTGTVSGRIFDAPRGSKGFGYDPLFFVEDLGRTFGETEEETKNALSHRGSAFRALRDHLATS